MAVTLRYRQSLHGDIVSVGAVAQSLISLTDDEVYLIRPLFLQPRHSQIYKRIRRIAFVTVHIRSVHGDGQGVHMVLVAYLRGRPQYPPRLFSDFGFLLWQEDDSLPFSVYHGSGCISVM